MDATPSITFGDLLRRYRRAAGMTQEELAERAHVSPRAISDLKRGVRTRPWHETVKFLADALQLEASACAQLEIVARRHVVSDATEPPGGRRPPKGWWTLNQFAGICHPAHRSEAVFAGGFTLEAVEAQNSMPGLVPDAEILDLLRNLVDKSLVVREEREGTGRYRLLEPLRQYAWDRLTEMGEAAMVRERHVDWCLALMAGARAEYYGPRQVAWAERIALEHDNLRLALAWCLDHDATRGLRLMRNLNLFWMTWGLDPEGQRWRDGLLARATEDTPERAWALVMAGVVARDFGDYPTATARIREGHVMATKVGEQVGLNWVLCFLGQIAAEQGEYVEAKTWYDDSLRLAREIGNDDAAADSQTGLAQLARFQGDYARAQAILDEDLADKWVRTQRVYVALGLAQSGIVAQATGDLPRARALLEESVALMREVVDRPSLGIALAHLGYLLGSTGDFKQAAVLLRESVELFQKLGHRPRAARALFFWGLVAIRERAHARGITLLAAAEATPGFFLTGLDPTQRADRDARLAEARQALGDAAADEDWARGSRMTFDKAVAFALATKLVDVG